MYFGGRAVTEFSSIALFRLEGYPARPGDWSTWEIWDKKNAQENVNGWREAKEENKMLSFIFLKIGRLRNDFLQAKKFWETE